MTRFCDFSLDVMGTMHIGEVQAVGVRYDTCDYESLEVKMTEVYERSLFHGSRLHTVHAGPPDAFT